MYNKHALAYWISIGVSFLLGIPAVIILGIDMPDTYNESSVNLFAITFIIGFILFLITIPTIE
jgi:hypothetical protein